MSAIDSLAGQFRLVDYELLQGLTRCQHSLMRVSPQHFPISSTFGSISFERAVETKKLKQNTFQSSTDAIRINFWINESAVSFDKSRFPDQIVSQKFRETLVAQCQFKFVCASFGENAKHRFGFFWIHPDWNADCCQPFQAENQQ